MTGQLGDDWMDAACKMTRVTALMRGTIRFPYHMERWSICHSGGEVIGVTRDFGSWGACSDRVTSVSPTYIKCCIAISKGHLSMSKGHLAISKGHLDIKRALPITRACVSLVCHKISPFGVYKAILRIRLHEPCGTRTKVSFVFSRVSYLEFDWPMVPYDIMVHSRQ